MTVLGGDLCENSYSMLFGVGDATSCRMIYMKDVTDQLPRLGRRKRICLLSFNSVNVCVFKRVLNEETSEFANVSKCFYLKNTF